MLGLTTATAARAQEPTRTPVPYEQVLSASPILWMFKWYNLDYERKINTVATWGVSGSYLEPGDSSYGRATVLVRYYPQGAALSGFYLGGQLGVYHTVYTDYDYPSSYPSSTGPTGQRRCESMSGAGIDLGYAWVMGARRNFSMSLGFGVSRLFGSHADDLPAMPNVRLFNVGYAF